VYVCVCAAAAAAAAAVCVCVCVCVCVWNVSVYYVHTLCVPVCVRTGTLYLSPYVRMLSAMNIMRAQYFSYFDT
jgi:hypothetical protein